LHAFEDAHVGEADFLDELQFGMLAQGIDCLGDLEHGADDVVARVSQVPEFVQRGQGFVDSLLVAALDHGLHLDRMRAIHDPEHVIAVEKSKAGVGTLQVVNRLSHIAFCGEDEGRDAVIRVLDFFSRADLHHPAHHLCVCQARVPQNRASGLQRLDDFIRLVACKCESRGGTVNLHGPSQSLLGATRHAVCLVQNHQLLPAGGQGDFFLGKALDAVTHDVDAAFVGGVELEHGFFVGVAEELARKAQDGCGFADARHARDDHVGHVAVFGDDFEALDGFGVADDVVEVDGAVFFHPGKLVTCAASSMGVWPYAIAGGCF